ncbi:MAG: hypothetical protein C5B43_01250 [Verrucomicrobia bacterium]|nr:MAG: hypothetical protein C5B43_01250 [Verrucomicrobiota bacterium]
MATANSINANGNGIAGYDGAGTWNASTVTQYSLLLGGANNHTIANLGVATNGQLPIGSTGGNPVLATLTAGAGMSITNAAGSITLAASGGGFTYVDQTTDLNPLVKSTAYFADKAASRLVLTLPTGATMGDTVVVSGFGAQGWQLNAGTGQTIEFGSSATTVAGSLASTNQYDQVTVVCSPTTTTWIVRNSVGNLTVA